MEDEAIFPNEEALFLEFLVVWVTLYPRDHSRSERWERDLKVNWAVWRRTLFRWRVTPFQVTEEGIFNPKLLSNNEVVYRRDQTWLFNNCLTVRNGQFLEIKPYTQPDLLSMRSNSWLQSGFVNPLTTALKVFVYDPILHTSNTPVQKNLIWFDSVE